MPRIRVLFMLGTLAAGGSERQVVESLKAIDRSRFQPMLYVVYREGELLAEVPADVPVFAYWDDHRPPRINWPGTIFRRQSRHLASILASERIDVVCERNFGMTLLSARACRGRPTARLAFVSSDPRADLAEGAGRFRWLKILYLRRAYREADRVVCVSSGVAAAVEDFYGLAREQLTTIYNFVDLERIARLAREFEPPFEPGRFHLVSVGRLHSAKGYPYLLEAVDELVHRRGAGQLLLWIIGRGPLQHELEALVASYRLEGHVRFTGYLANPLPYMKHAQLLCLTSLYEGMPNVLVEAMACGTPVLSTDCPSGPAEILQGGTLGGLVPPGDVPALADALADAVGNPGPWLARTAAARRRVEACYSRQASMAALEQLIAAVAVPSRPAANRAGGAVEGRGERG